MRLALCTLALNEAEHLDRLYRQHADWRGAELARWVFVESADRVYAECNPDMVTPDGLSTDGTSEFLADLARRDPRVSYVPHGFSRHKDPAQGKCESRNRYLDVCESSEPDFLLVLDSDEFYTRAHQAQVSRLMETAPQVYTAFMFGLRTIWRPPSIAGRPLFDLEAVGSLFSVPICRGWRFLPGMRYAGNHNTPVDSSGNPLMRGVRRFDRRAGAPYCVHLGFTSSLRTRQAKHRYYERRGEGRGDGRERYVACRRCFETYQPGDPLPHGARLIPYTGEVPEVFREGQT